MLPIIDIALRIFEIMEFSKIKKHLLSMIFLFIGPTKQDILRKALYLLRKQQ